MAGFKGQLSGKERVRLWYHCYCFCKTTVHGSSQPELSPLPVWFQEL